MTERTYLCLDGGTTNTRLRLVRGGVVLDTEKAGIGSSSRDKEPLKAAVRAMIASVLSRNSLREEEIEAILAVGMITSEFGLFELPHLYAPAGRAAFHRGMARAEMPALSSVPFFFLPGFRNAPGSYDMMRGEESECLGLCALCGITSPTAVLLPGSHNKVILSDGEKIEACHSTISGELIAAAAENTILRHCFSRPFPKGSDEGALRSGAEDCAENGLTAALIHIRPMALSGGKSEVFLFSYLVGAILFEDVTAIRRFAGDRPLLIGGASPLREELAVLCGKYLPNRLLCADAEKAEIASAIGSVLIYEEA